MKTDQFLNLLKDSSSLTEVPLEDMELLYTKYPFSKNIQVLYNKKRSLLGLTQNTLPIEKLRAQHNHPVLLEQILSAKDSEEYESINMIYDSIFSKLDAPSPAIEDTPEVVNLLSPSLESIPMKDPEELTKQGPPETIEVLDPTTFEETEHVDIERILESKKRKNDAKQLKSIQFKEEDLKAKQQESLSTPTEIESVKFIEVEAFKLSNKPQVKSKKKNKKSKKKKSKSKSIKTVVDHLKTKNKRKSTSNKVDKRRTTKKEPKPILTVKELDYSGWLDSLKSTKDLLMSEVTVVTKSKKKKSKNAKENNSKKGKKKGQKKKDKLQDKIDKSLERNNHIYSETLASLMEKQGHKKQAIDIYEQLMINNPEKSDYFANRIQKLK